MVADALAPLVARPSATMLLTMEDKQVLVIHKVRFQLPLPSEFWELLENLNIFSCLLKLILYIKGSKIAIDMK